VAQMHLLDIGTLSETKAGIEVSLPRLNPSLLQHRSRGAIAQHISCDEICLQWYC
jgi:hypothetical protein